MTRELLVESVWQALCFTLPVRRTDFHMFMFTFLEAPKKEFSLWSVDDEPIGSVEESILDFIIDIRNPKYEWMKDRVTAELNKIAEFRRKAEHADRKSGKFKEITFGQTTPDYGLKQGDVIEGWGHIL